ncbi:hypothetical protein [Jannaschia donghaensis]|uniref:Uncharacterized protein n=1 Tax=Jannaschia donghaensis TaxID=420998 RepID=A0A0M6YJZ4_9RHOB|nr:hypothetical protein [Jannaschia donghaensis]CTQ50678.1 hypothetical protein JDO7802_02704 [Jannaschia donghaensis]
MAVLRFVYALYLRLAGLFLLILGAGYLEAGVLVEQAGITIQQVEIWVPFAAIGLGIFMLVPWWLPKGLRRPTRSRDLIWLALPALGALLGPLLRIPLYDVLPQVSTLEPEAAAFMQQPVSPVVSVGLPFVLMLLLVLPSMRSGVPADRPDPVGAKPVKEKRPAKIPEKKLPALGAAMKLYIVADWAMLRAMGLGLMATAYMLWTLIQDGRLSQAAALSHGKDPMLAVYIYGGVGAMLAIPFLLPGRIARPQHVVFGLIKAILLVVAAYVLIEPLKVAIVTFTPDIYHATLIETVPRLFKAICGVAVTSALLISFFRQLNGLPAVDYKGDAKVHLSQDQLHDLRKARMPG